MRTLGRAILWWGAGLVAVGVLLHPGADRGRAQDGRAGQAAPRAAAPRANAAPKAAPDAMADADAQALAPTPRPDAGRDGPGDSPRPAARVRPVAGPVRQGPVLDDARLLRGDERRAAWALTEQVARESGVQFGLLTLANPGDVPVAELSLRAAEKLKLGQKGKDDGLLLVVAPSAREARLEVGYGLEHVLPDAVCARLLRRNFADAGGGGGGVQGAQVLAAMQAVRAELAEAVASGKLAPPEARPDVPAAGAGDWVPLLLFALVVVWLLSQSGGRGGRGPRVSWWPGVPFGGSGGFGGGGNDTRGGGGGFGGGGASSRW